MYKLIILMSLVGPSAFANVTWSDVLNTEKALAECNQRARSVPARLACKVSARQQADDLLAELYVGIKEIAKQAGPDKAELVQQVLRRLELRQAEWPKFREAECRFESAIAFEARTEGLVFEDCLWTETKIRLARLIGVNLFK